MGVVGDDRMVNRMVDKGARELLQDNRDECAEMNNDDKFYKSPYSFKRSTPLSTPTIHYLLLFRDTTTEDEEVEKEEESLLLIGQIHRLT